MKDSVAIVTGASQGIGRSTAIRLARDFSAVVVAARNAKALEEVVVVRDNDFIGVAAPTAHLAQHTIEMIADSAKWETSQHPSSGELFDYLRQNARGGVPKNPFADEVAKSPKLLKQSYHVAYIQHCPMEPRAAMAEWQDGKLTVYHGGQVPFGVKAELVRAFGIADDRVRAAYLGEELAS